MAENSAIQWTQATWNPLAGCKEISPGCTNCYAAVMAHRLEAMGQEKYKDTTRKLANGKVVWTGKISLDESALSIPLKRKKPTTYFVNSMSDLFHEDVPDAFIDSVFRVMINCPQHTFQVLTKRAVRMAKYTSDRWGTFHGKAYSLMGHIWLGVSCEDQQRADERIPLLLRTQAAVRFLSCEPLLGPIQLSTACPEFNRDAFPCDALDIDWVIVGGESGHGARPCDISWVRSIVEQCKAADVAVFVKQLGSNIENNGIPWPNAAWAAGVSGMKSKFSLNDSKGGAPEEWPADLRVREFPEPAKVGA